MTDPDKLSQEPTNQPAAEPTSEPPEAGKSAKAKKAKKPKKATKEKNPYGFFKKRRGGVLLTKEEVKQIKAGRKKLRAELRKNGEKDRKEFELTASSVGLYFDGNKLGVIFNWFLANKGLRFLAFVAVLLLLVLWLFSAIADMKGHFTINMSNEMFREGFAISEDKDFKTKTSHLFATPAANVPCISIVDIPENVDTVNGEHNGNYFAYTFYLRNEGETSADYQWELRLDSPTPLSKAAWMMVFIDGKMTLYAQKNDDGTEAALPIRGNDTVGYLKPPMYEYAKDKSQYEVIAKRGSLTYWRVVPKPFESDTIVASGKHMNVHAGEVHKYTIVLWLEGDDPDCTEDIISASLGLEMFMAMIDEKGIGE